MEAGDGVIESGTVLDVQDSSLVWLAVDADCNPKAPLERRAIPCGSGFACIASARPVNGYI